MLFIIVLKMFVDCVNQLLPPSHIQTYMNWIRHFWRLIYHSFYEVIISLDIRAYGHYIAQESFCISLTGFELTCVHYCERECDKVKVTFLTQRNKNKVLSITALLYLAKRFLDGRVSSMCTLQNCFPTHGRLLSCQPLVQCVVSFCCL